MSRKKSSKSNLQDSMPSAEKVQRELAKAESMDDFFGKDGIFARLFANTLEQMPCPHHYWIEAQLGQAALQLFK